ncbi:nucleolar DEAD-box protein required for synthesis of 60S ribosomal subunit [Elasticomyces elasticus]|nr:nucleolar DEAD-box protein required for synthesis of 60S ribosomal subunit [Elasticomyces elasticus]
MAPQDHLGDEFVLTISDNETGFSEDDKSVEEEDNTKKKRKREAPGKKIKSKKRQKVARQSSDSEHEESTTSIGEDDGTIDPDFEFQLVDSGPALKDFDGWDMGGTPRGDKKAVDVDEIVARRKQKAAAQPNGADREDPEQDHVEVDGVEMDEKFEGFDHEEENELMAEDGFGMGAQHEDEEDEEDEEHASEEESGAEDGVVGGPDEDADSDGDEVVKQVPHPDDAVSDKSDEEDEEDDSLEAEKRAAFFAPEDNVNGGKPSAASTSGSFQGMSLSRPILKGLASIGFTEPTPIQSKTIPVALLGKDIVGGAETGSGKTAAFVIPIIERLLYRPNKVARTRVAILMPTRELALQCFNVAKKLASYTDITFGQAIGGMSSREQEMALKLRPDIVVATPGRFIDFMRNSSSFAVDTIEILVLDEADRMLEDGFADELNEILTTIPKSRQTMLFSATMTSSVDNLIRAGLNRPVRLMVDAKRQTVAGLVQEFVRLRPGRETKRLGPLLYLCKNIYTARTIIFFRQKAMAHRTRIIFSLLDLRAAELHGSMSQDQRIGAIEAFRSGAADFLLATDLASRGLDIKGVETVINFEAPQSHEIYLHRVGRTARAGRTGRACTIAAEPDRKVVKAAVKAGKAQGAVIKQRTVSPSDMDIWQEKTDGLEEEIEAVLREEKEEKLLAQTEMQVQRSTNIMEHEAEIKARPKKTWFESEKDKQTAKSKGRVELNGPDVVAGKEKKKKKLSGKEKKKLLDRDDRVGGRQWKKGSAERAGRGVVADAKNKGKGKDGKKKEKKGGSVGKGRSSKR